MVPPPPGSVIAPPPPPPAPKYHPSAIISAAPVRYNLPPPPADLPANDEELDELVAEAREEKAKGAGKREKETPANRGKNKALEMMAKMGYKKGYGLGADESGILEPLRHQQQKRKRKPDALGGGFEGPSIGRIIGGKKRKNSQDGPRSSSVVICRHMVDGMDLDHEMGPQGNLVEEIGQECAKNVSVQVFLYQIIF